MKRKYDVAAYIWPSYTGDENRTRIFWQEGIGEWQTVHNVRKNSVNKPKEYVWNRRPLWGYVNEANSDVMEMEIECAARYGVNVFIYDWYWFDNRPFLENCLNDGYLKARNNDKVKFYIMWANHNATHLWSVDLVDEFHEDVIWNGTVSRSQFETIVERWITKYFSHPSYYKIDGKPVFSIYDVENFVKGIGGFEAAKDALEYFRGEVKKAGYPGLHLQIISRGVDFGMKLDDGRVIDICNDLGFDSTTEYQMQAVVDLKEYDKAIEPMKRHYAAMSKRGGAEYMPHVSLGWDTNPRLKVFDPKVTRNNTPENIEKALRNAKEYIDTHDMSAPLVTVNSWNEWTETSYLLPDNLYGYGYLEAVKKVFKDEE